MATPGYLLPHRSHRADFPQRVPQTGLTGLHPDMADLRRQQRMTTKELFVALPRHPVSARATIQPLSPDPNNTPIELQKALRVCRASVVLVVASELGVEGLLLLVHRCMSVLLAPRGDGREAPAEPFTHRSHMHGELPSPAACANVRQTEKVEGAGFLLALLLRTLLGVTPKFQQPRLLRVKCQTVFCEPLR